MTGSRRQQPVDTALACYYADDPARRPQCTLTATVQLGAVALCTSCNAARSTLGKGQAPVLLPAGPEFDVLGWVATAHQQTNAAEATLAAAVTRARQTGASWTIIGAQLGLSRQGAQQRFTRIRT
jgi:L-lactate utilization protein LutC